MAGIGILSSEVREDDGGGAVNVYRYGDCAYMSPTIGGVTPATDRVQVPQGYKLVVVEAVGGDAWVVQGDATVTAPPLSGGAGRGRYLAEGKELALPVPPGRADAKYIAARAAVGTPTVYVYGLGL